MHAAIPRHRGFPMAMVTWLQAVGEAELARLRAEPDTIGRLDVPDASSTRYECSLDCFLTGEAYPVDHPLASVVWWRTPPEPAGAVVIHGPGA